MKTSIWRAATAAVLSVALINLGFIGAAQAAIVETGALVTTTRDANLASIRSQLNRTEVQQQMKSMGVDAASIDTRIAGLSDLELQKLAQDMQSAPAGGDGALAVIGVVFVILVILELVGVIDIFKRAP